MSKTKEQVQLKYIGYLEHYEREAHLKDDGSVDRQPTSAERFASSDRVVDDLRERRGIDQDSVTFNFENDFTNTVSREAADWLIEHEKGEWVILGQTKPDQVLHTEAE